MQGENLIIGSRRLAQHARSCVSRACAGFQIILPPGISALVLVTFGVGGQDLRPLPRWRHVYELEL